MTPKPFTVDDSFLTIDSAERTILLDGEPLPLTYREYALLALFLQHPKRVFEREELLEQVWGFDFSGQTRAVDIMVQRLRKKLGPQGERLKTIYGAGYKWVDA